MNTRITILIVIVAILLSSCAAGANPAPSPIAVQPVQQSAEQPAAQPYVQKPLAQPLPTMAAPAELAPAPTAAAVAPLAAQPAAGGILPVAPPPADNQFRDYGVNPWVESAGDHLSTFALDVDTASYTVARRYVMDGNLPPADAVRVEEFVNYFNQEYPTPPDIAFSIYADGAPSPFTNDGTQILRVGIQGYQVPEELRKPASLTFVIDVSGSMDMENRLGLVKQSLQMLVERLRPSDTVAIVVYGSAARVLLNPTSGEDRQAILNAINSLYPEGATNAAEGLRLGYQMASLAFRPDGINRVILCSDGVANVGDTNAGAILETTSGYTERGITLTSIGVGMGNFNDVLMEQLADKGDGNYFYVDDLTEARRVFVDQLTSTLQVIAKDAKVQVDFNRDIVVRYRLIGYENRAVADQDFRNDAVDAGEIGAGHSVTALYAVQLNPASQGRIATVQLRWKDPQSGEVREINGNYNTWDLTQSFEQASPRYQLAVAVAQYAEMLRFSPWAAGSSMHQVLDQVVRISGLLPGDAQVAEFVSLVSRARQIKAFDD